MRLGEPPRDVRGHRDGSPNGAGVLCRRFIGSRRRPCRGWRRRFSSRRTVVDGRFSRRGRPGCRVRGSGPSGGRRGGAFSDLAGRGVQGCEEGRGARAHVVVAAALTHLAAAIDLVDQSVASFGVSSSVFTMTRTTSASVIFRGTPGRGSSHRPSSRRSRKRRRQRRTVSMVMPSRRATSAIACPSAGAPVLADVLDQTEQRENLAEAIVDFWKDADARDPALALCGPSTWTMGSFSAASWKGRRG